MPIAQAHSDLRELPTYSSSGDAQRNVCAFILTAKGDLQGFEIAVYKETRRSLDH